MPSSDTWFTSENAAEMQARGVEAQRESRRRKRSMRESMKMLLSLPMVDGAIDTDFSSYANLIHSNATVQDATLAGLAKRAAEQGDPAAVKLIREIVGSDEPNADGGRDVELAPHIIEKFYKGPHYEIVTKRSNHIWLPGGRGGTKSAFAAFEIIRGIEADPNACAVAFRKVGATLRDSVYAQVQFAIRTLGLQDEYDATINPIQIRKRSTGQVILFRGCDKAEKAKGITLPDPSMRIKYVWVEEADQFDGMEEVRVLLQSVVRGTDDVTVLFTYNPPRSRDAWVNSEVLHDDGKYVCESNYMDVPPEWLGQVFIDEAESLKEWNEEAYRHEYLGEPVGYGAQVFENLELREIGQDELESCSAWYNGVDWGYYPDPWVFLRIGVQSAQRRIYMAYELTGTRMSNEQTATAIETLLRKCGVKHPEDEVITCDSAEPKSIEEYRRLGLKAQKCTKYPGSVETGMKALAGNWTIVIDPNRTPMAAREFNGYEFVRLKSGEVVSQYPDADNHTIDAARYALERILAGKDR